MKFSKMFKCKNNSVEIQCRNKLLLFEKDLAIYLIYYLFFDVIK